MITYIVEIFISYLTVAFLLQCNCHAQKKIVLQDTVYFMIYFQITSHTNYTIMRKKHKHSVITIYLKTKYLDSPHYIMNNNLHVMNTLISMLCIMQLFLL